MHSHMYVVVTDDIPKNGTWRMYVECMYVGYIYIYIYIYKYTNTRARTHTHIPTRIYTPGFNPVFRLRSLQGPAALQNIGMHRQTDR